MGVRSEACSPGTSLYQSNQTAVESHHLSPHHSAGQLPVLTAMEQYRAAFVESRPHVD